MCHSLFWHIVMEINMPFAKDPMKTIDTYRDLCTQVYDLSKPEPPEEAYTFYRVYASNAKGPILEPMCGTGRFLLPLFVILLIHK